MSDVPVFTQMVIETVCGVFLLFFLWFVVSVLREVMRRLKVLRWASAHPELVGTTTTTKENLPR